MLNGVLKRHLIARKHGVKEGVKGPLAEKI